MHDFFKIFNAKDIWKSLLIKIVPIILWYNINLYKQCFIQFHFYKMHFLATFTTTQLELLYIIIYMYVIIFVHLKFYSCKNIMSQKI